MSKLIGCPLITFKFSTEKQPTDDFVDNITETIYHKSNIPIESFNCEHSVYDFEVYIHIYQHEDVNKMLNFLMELAKTRGYINVKFDIKEKLNLKF